MRICIIFNLASSIFFILIFMSYFTMGNLINDKSFYQNKTIHFDNNNNNCTYSLLQIDATLSEENLFNTYLTLEERKFAETQSTGNNGIVMKYSVQSQTMPCCSESIGSHACVELRNRRPYEFKTRCKTDADFGMLQCCLTCRTDVIELGKNLFARGTKSKHCFDRHNRKFCQHFIHQGSMWAANHKKQVSCNGESASLAFRICRRSCGFCNPGLYEAGRKSPKCPTNETHTINGVKNSRRVTIVYPGVGGGQVIVEVTTKKVSNTGSTTKLPLSTTITMATTPTSNPSPVAITSTQTPVAIIPPEVPLVVPPPPPVVLPLPTLPPPVVTAEPWWPVEPLLPPQPMTITWRPVPNPWPFPQPSQVISPGWPSVPQPIVPEPYPLWPATPMPMPFPFPGPTVATTPSWKGLPEPLQPWPDEPFSSVN